MKVPEIFTGRLGNKMFQTAYLYAQVKDGVIPDWYVQDIKYFGKYADEIKKLFGDGIGFLDYVAVHLRVGKNPINPQEPSYYDNSFYVNLSKTGYYIDATNLFKGRKFLVFSDDIPFAKTYFEGSKFYFDDSKDEIESLNKMASCDGHIIANSSFSWWGAFLSPNHGKLIYPKLWFSDGVKRVGCPQDWLAV